MKDIVSFGAGLVVCAFLIAGLDAVCDGILIPYLLDRPIVAVLMFIVFGMTATVEIPHVR